MKHLSNAHKLKKQIAIEVIKNYLNESLEDNLKHIPVNLRPRIKTSSRCCVYKDREIIKHRVMAAMGIATEDEIDETTSLAEYAEVALQRNNPNDKILSVLDIACQSCVKARYLVTEACQGCLARPCTTSCPQNTIYVKDGQACIDYAKCIDCGKCVKACPYSAIIHIPVPCEKECPVGAIKKNIYNQQYIDFDKCIYCGKCMNSCPFGAILEVSQVLDVLKAVKSQKKVVALIAPSIEGQFPNSLKQTMSGIKAVGFSEVFEVAYGAEITIKNEAEEFIEKMHSGEPLMTTSCCPSYIEAVAKHVPEIAPFVSDTLSPLQYAANKFKDNDPEVVTVFIGPCLAKKKEALDGNNIDYCLTFEELGSLFIAMNIDVAVIDAAPLITEPNSDARGFAVSEGVSKAVINEVNKRDDAEIKINGRIINGISKKSLTMLKMYALGKIPANFLEVMACEGGCSGGPCTLGTVKLTRLKK